MCLRLRPLALMAHLLDLFPSPVRRNQLARNYRKHEIPGLLDFKTVAQDVGNLLTLRSVPFYLLGNISGTYFRPKLGAIP